MTTGPAGPTASLRSLFRVSPNRDLQFQTLKLTFSSAETSAILGRGAGARFLIKSMTSGGTARRAGYHLTPRMRHGAHQGDPRAEKQGFPLGTSSTRVHRSPLFPRPEAAPAPLQAPARQDAGWGTRGDRCAYFNGSVLKSGRSEHLALTLNAKAPGVWSAPG